MTQFIKTQFLTLFAYHWHTHNRLFDLAAQLDEADYKDGTGYGQGSIHGLFFHLLRTMNSWRQGLETGKRISPLKVEDYPTHEALRIGFEAEQSAWNILIEQMSAADIERDINLTTRRGDLVAFPRWRILQHLVLHGMQHHAEIAELLTQKAHSPGDIDFIFFK